MTISKAYQKQLQAHHGNKGRWGGSGHRYAGADVAGILVHNPAIVTVLDFGAGKCALSKGVLDRLGPESRLGRPIEWTNYDPGIRDLQATPRGKFDLVITSDMFEHVEPEHVRETIQQVAELTKYTMYNNIACQLTGKPIAEEGPYQGQDMHISVHSPEWWRDEFEAAVPHMSLLQWNSRERRTKRQPTNQTGYSKRCIMIHERIK